MYRKESITYDDFAKAIKRYGFISAIILMEDKLNRLIPLLRGAENKIKNESVKEMLQDLANYTISTLIELEENGL